MICSSKVWERIRPLFDLDEKATLRAAINGQVVCPEGWSIDETQLPTELRVKFFAAYGEHLNK